MRCHSGAEGAELGSVHAGLEGMGNKTPVVAVS